MKTYVNYVMNKYRKFCVKMFLDYIDIAIFVLGYFILPHPVDSLKRSLFERSLRASETDGFLSRRS